MFIIQDPASPAQLEAGNSNKLCCPCLLWHLAPLADRAVD